jgi:hypothetical protein
LVFDLTTRTEIQDVGENRMLWKAFEPKREEVTKGTDKTR